MNTPIWIPVATLVIAAANFGWLIWRHYAKPKPPLVFRIEPWGGPEHPNCFVAIIQPVEGHDGRMIGLRGHGVLLARVMTGGESFNPQIIGPGPFARDYPTEWPLRFGQKEEVRVHFFATPSMVGWSPLSWRSQKSREVSARISLTAPIKVQIAKKIPIRVT